MSRGFARLLHPRRRPEADRVGVDGAAVAVEDAPLGPPPALLPAAIFRQYLFDPMEYTPEWARPRTPPAQAPNPAVASAATVAEPAIATAPVTDQAKPPARARRPKANGTSSGTGTRSKRTPKPKE